MESGKFVVATPTRSVCDENARVLVRLNALRFIALGTRRGTRGVPKDLTRLNPAIGLAAYLASRALSVYRAESFRFRLHPWFDRWVKRQLVPGDHIISSYGYVNRSFEYVRKHGGHTFLDGGNSHPENYWLTVSEEHARWKYPSPPFARHWYEQGMAMLPNVDYVLSPSSYVTRSFLERGFRRDQIVPNIYPVDLSCFTPPAAPRPQTRPLTLISTGQLSLRKGTPYLLEAFRMIRKRHPSARLLLTRNVHDSMKSILSRFSELPIEWAPPLPHPQLAARLREADIFVLPSLEEGLARTGLEALACGLPVIVTAHTGVNDLVVPGVSGSVIPLRSPEAIASAVCEWADRIIGTGWQPRALADLKLLSFDHFASEFTKSLKELNLLQRTS